jgi:hypothetical protein
MSPWPPTWWSLCDAQLSLALAVKSTKLAATTAQAVDASHKGFRLARDMGTMVVPLDRERHGPRPGVLGPHERPLSAGAVHCLLSGKPGALFQVEAQAFCHREVPLAWRGPITSGEAIRPGPSA